MKKIIFWIVLLSFPTFLLAQATDDSELDYGNKDYFRVDRVLTTNFENDYPALINLKSLNGAREVLGKDVLNTEWEQSNVIIKDGQTFSIMARYDNYNDEIQIKQDGQVKALFPSKVAVVKVGDAIFAPFELKDGKLGFFEVLTTGKIKVLRRYSVNMEITRINPLSSSGNEQTLVENIAIYYTDGNSQPIKLKKNKRFVYKLISEKHTEMVSFQKKFKINLRKENDLIRFFEFYNSLSEE